LVFEALNNNMQHISETIIFTIHNCIKINHACKPSDFSSLLSLINMNKKSPRNVRPCHLTPSPQGAKYPAVTQDTSPSGVNFESW